jgi:cytochrome c oxidase subunit II
LTTQPEVSTPVADYRAGNRAATPAVKLRPFLAICHGINPGISLAYTRTDRSMSMIRRHHRYLILIVVLLAATAPSGGSSAQSQEPRVIEVVAKRFAFEPAEIEVAVGERVTLAVRSADGVHGIEIKKFKVKKEIPRGAAPVMMEFTASEAGRFPILCSEYCGDGHEDMTGTLVVKARDAQAP